jgi:hypothetical protein
MPRQKDSVRFILFIYNNRMENDFDLSITITIEKFEQKIKYNSRYIESQKVDKEDVNNTNKTDDNSECAFQLFVFRLYIDDDMFTYC